jgi:ADP-heptose:LPS heptosyltransferase
MAVYIAPVSSGLGDLIVSLPAIQGLIASGEKTYVVARSFRQTGITGRIEGAAGEILEEEFLARKLAEGERFVNLRDHPMQRDWVWGSPEFEKEFGPLKMMEIVEMLSRDMGIVTDFEKLTPLRFNCVPTLAGTVIFIPGSDGYCKHWPTEYWLDLHASLRRSGCEVAMIGQPDHSPAARALLEGGVAWHKTPTMGDAIDAISSCLAVVAVDTGLMHIAVHQGKPTVALFNRQGLYQRREGNCRPLLTIECPEQCQTLFPIHANFHKTTFRADENKIDLRPCPLPNEESCMGSIRPANVISALSSFPELGKLISKSAVG